MINRKNGEVLKKIAEDITICAWNTGTEYGNGFNEKVYENVLVIKLREIGYEVQQQTELQIKYKQSVVGSLIADIIVEESIIMELKAVKKLEEEHRQQLRNYLKVTGIKAGMLINFGSQRPEIEACET